MAVIDDADFKFGSANNEQKEAIRATDGPVLITAGPGTGKTFTLMKRAAYLVKVRGVAPENIMITTFTEKAAKELITRITNEFNDQGIKANINDMYIGTFHSICLKIMEENLEFADLGHNYKTLDSFDQKYMVNNNIYKFKNENWESFKRICLHKKNNKNEDEDEDEDEDEEGKNENTNEQNINNTTVSDGAEGNDNLGDEENEMFYRNDAHWWSAAEVICNYANKLTEELADIDAMKKSDDPDVAALGTMVATYQELLNKQHALDFSNIQVKCYKMLKDHPEILEKLQEKVKYMMVDEYQDTNYIQEQLVLLIGGKNNNICVVGDDDQGMYRFRGATISNIFNFPNKPQFKDKKCQTIKLTKNYRSNSDIVDFYNAWMHNTKNFGWGNCRYDKTIEAQSGNAKSPAVVKLTSCKAKGSNGCEKEEAFNDWNKKILDFINKLMDSGKITNLNQIAFLFNSVTKKEVRNLADYLEDHGVPVYSPRSGMFFERYEIKLTVGCLLKMFPNYVNNMKNGEYEKILINYNYIKNKEIDTKSYYNKCLETADELISKPEHANLKAFIEKYAKIHADLQDNTDYAFSGLLYRLFSFKPFSGEEMLGIDLNANGGVYNTRAARNLADFTKQIARYEYLYNIKNNLSAKQKGDKKYIDIETEDLFNTYLRLLINENVQEYEDDSEYAPSGCVSFTTFHGAKGMEFPVVFVGSLGERIKGNNDDKLMKKAKAYYDRAKNGEEELEPEDKTKHFDYWRRYYVAFSRAQNLLVLTAADKTGTAQTIGGNFKPFFEKQKIKDADNPAEFDLQDFEKFANVKPVELKNSYSFTSQISYYEACPMQYKFFKELGFAPVREGGRVFGSLVHQTIEDMNRAVLRGSEDEITEENIENWFNTNYDSLAKTEHTYLQQNSKDKALKEVKRYAERQKEEGQWHNIKNAEEDVSLIKDKYIINGKIDLIKGNTDDTVELVDFKSEKKPKNQEEVKRNEHYSNQLRLYAYLIEQRTGQTVNGIKLYYTKEEKDPWYAIDYDTATIQQTIDDFDATVNKIEAKDFNHRTTNRKICRECDFRYYCGKADPMV